MAQRLVDQRFELFHDLAGEVTEGILGSADEPAGAIEIRHWGGTMAAPGPGGGPAGHRDVPFSVLAVAMSQHPDQLASRSPQLDRLVTQLRPHATGGSFLNFLTDVSRTETAYTTTNFRRLTEVKQIWDPSNVFRTGHNIAPAMDRNTGVTGVKGDQR
jgi:hypothetical protein